MYRCLHNQRLKLPSPPISRFSSFFYSSSSSSSQEFLCQEFSKSSPPCGLRRLVHTKRRRDHYNSTKIQGKNRKKSKQPQMESPFSTVPYHDPYCDFPSTDQILIFDENPSLEFMELASVGESSSFSALVSESEEVGFGDDCSKLWDPDDLLSDSFILEMINESKLDIMGNCVVDASGNNGERVGEGHVVDTQQDLGHVVDSRILQDLENVVDSQIPQGLGTGNQMQLPVPAVSQPPYSCTFCHILREIIHVNGIHVRNLEIHGRVGVITHAVLDKYDFDSSSENHEFQMFDFCNESMSTVKTFLIQYCEDCRREGYSMLRDPLSQFYQALCIGYNENVNIACNDFLQSQPPVSGDLQTNQQNPASQQDHESNGISFFRSDREMIHSQRDAEGKVAVSSKSFLATQRERTGKMKLKDFSGYFDLPIHEAAKRMNVCPTVIKKKCRQGGLSRWPYRKIKGIKRKILKKQEILKAGTAEERACAADDIRMLEQELENIFAKFSH